MKEEKNIKTEDIKKTNENCESISEKDNECLLNAIYKNLRIGTQSIENVLSNIKLNDITLELSKESSQYYVFEKECAMIADSKDINLKENNLMMKTQLWASVKLNLLSSSDVQHIAEMLLVGTMMGVIDLVKARTNYDFADKEILDLSNKVLQFERDNIESQFKYLKIKPQKIDSEIEKDKDN